MLDQLKTFIMALRHSQRRFGAKFPKITLEFPDERSRDAFKMALREDMTWLLPVESPGPDRVGNSGRIADVEIEFTCRG